MNFGFVICFLAVVVGIQAATKYTDKFDSIDVDSILKSERLVKNYIKCFLNKGPCTPDGKEIKDTLPDALKTDCSKCTDKQKQASDKITDYILTHKLDEYKEMEAIYDPTGIYLKRYNDKWSAIDPKKVLVID